MDELYRFHSSISCPVDDSNFLGDGSSTRRNNSSNYYNHQEMVLTAAAQLGESDDQVVTGLAQMSDIIKAQIANHPLYPNLLSAYIDCRKVGAPAQMASLLEEINRENPHQPISTCTQIGTDPQLDDFMKSYCEVLQKYKEELSKPFDEATNFLSIIESQLTHLCNQTLPSPTYPFHSSPDEVGGPSDEDMNMQEAPPEYSTNSGGGGGNGNHMINHGGDNELKEMLMRKYSGYLSSLKKEFLKKRKKGKLPKDALTALLDWWNTHYRWPYPTEEEKNRLSEMTGLDQKQINNWFINQRKRHWRPSEDMRFALMEGVSDTVGGGSMHFDAGGN